MKNSLFAVLALVAITGGLVFSTGCFPDFNAADSTYSCENSEDCLAGYTCTDGFCVGGVGGDDVGIPDANGNNEVCDPDNPPAEPFDIQEVCDGQDNNCDGHIDVIFCQSSSDCPSGDDALDAEGHGVNYRCNQDLDPPQCEAMTWDTFSCPDPLECINGQIEAIPDPACR